MTIQSYKIDYANTQTSNSYELKPKTSPLQHAKPNIFPTQHSKCVWYALAAPNPPQVSHSIHNTGSLGNCLGFGINDEFWPQRGHIMRIQGIKQSEIEYFGIKSWVVFTSHLMPCLVYYIPVAWKAVRRRLLSIDCAEVFPCRNCPERSPLRAYPQVFPDLRRSRKLGCCEPVGWPCPDHHPICRPCSKEVHVDLPRYRILPVITSNGRSSRRGGGNRRNMSIYPPPRCRTVRRALMGGSASPASPPPWHELLS